MNASQNLAVAFITNCHQAERAARAASQWDELLAAFDGVAVTLFRHRIMQGDLKSAATHMITPRTRVACAMTFLAEIERYLDDDDVRELRELWKQPAQDKVRAFDHLLPTQNKIRN